MRQRVPDRQRTDQTPKETNKGPAIGPNDPARFINRELSWLAFNQRVIEEAMNTAHPLFERVRFLAISASNLNEFYMVRVAGLAAQWKAGYECDSDDGMSVKEQLAAISNKVAVFLEQQQEAWRGLQRDLAKEGITVVDGENITKKERKWLDRYFMEEFFPVLTPIAIDPAHPFPFIPNCGLCIVFKLEQNRTKEMMRALVPLPPGVPRFTRIPGPPARFISLESLISFYLDELFPGYTILGKGLFRIIRDSEVEFEEEAEDLLRVISSAIERRRRGSVIRLSFSHEIPRDLRTFVASQLQVAGSDVFVLKGLLGLADIAELVTDDRRDLLFEPFSPRFPQRIASFGGDAFAAIREKDIIVHHPYESFDVVVQLLRQAAEDPAVVSIKQTLYRTSNDSPIVEALITAAEAGKSVTAMVELKARFEEEANIRWSRDMERAGVQVVYGFVNLKTHAKVSLITRREGLFIRSYVHFGTGNYHPLTARIYTDLSLFTCDLALCRDAARLFNLMTGYARPEKLEKLRVSPLNLREGLYSLINDEIEHARAGQPAAIWAKMNQLVDPDVIDRLYQASQAGVEVRLIVRGICCLRPGVKGLSENIVVKSVVGRFLEHSRITCFGAGHKLPSPEAKVFISSADWMPRNFNWRIEAMIPVENPTVHSQVLDEIMVVLFHDNTQSWILNPDGTYNRVKPGDEPFDAQEYFLTNPSLSGSSSRVRTDNNVSKLFFWKN